MFTLFEPRIVKPIQGGVEGWVEGGGGGGGETWEPSQCSYHGEDTQYNVRCALPALNGQHIVVTAIAIESAINFDGTLYSWKQNRKQAQYIDLNSLRFRHAASLTSKQ